MFLVKLRLHQGKLFSSLHLTICIALCILNSRADSSDLLELMTNMKQSLDKVSDKLTNIDARMEKFEVQQNTMEEELRDFKSTGCSASMNSKGRERIVPPELAVRYSISVCELYIRSMNLLAELLINRAKCEDFTTHLMKKNSSE